MIANQKLLNDQMANQTDQQKTGSAVSGSVPDVKTNYPDVSIKELIAKKEVQEAIQRYIDVPKVVTIKKSANKKSSRNL